MRHYRDALIARYPNQVLDDGNEPFRELEPLVALNLEDVFLMADETEGDPPATEIRPWRFPLWQTADQLDFFAYLGPGRMDGVCLIERIDLPDGRIVVACLQMPSNPGKSITNAVEVICHQVTQRFDIPADQLIWLEHYPFVDDLEWSQISFARHPPNSAFAEPTWTKMTPQRWSDLGLSPRKTLRIRGSGYRSKLKKHFAWPPPEDQG